MTAGVHVEVFLAAGYALFLALVCAVLELTARHTHHRAHRYRVAGFKYHQDLDSWECPAGQPLHRHETDHAKRVVRYRASARVCNHCAFKARCTDSDEGRELSVSSLTWIETEVGRFHRGLSLLLLLLAQLLLASAWARFHAPEESALLASLLAPASLVWGRLLLRFRREGKPRGAQPEPERGLNLRRPA